MKSTLRSMSLGAVLVAGGAFAQGLTCPAGSKTVSMEDQDLLVSRCIRTQGADGLCHGQYQVKYRSTGKVHTQGQCADGMRTGQWVYFGLDGAKVAEIQFKNGEYHGQKVEFHANGKKKLEEKWNQGRLEGTTRTFDTSGKPSGGIVPTNTAAK